MQTQDFLSSNNIKYIDYKDIVLMKQFLNPSGRIISRKRNSLTAKNQRALANAVKRARIMGLLPFVAR